MTAALFAGKPMTCRERFEAMLMQYVVAAFVLGIMLGSALS
jgi:hypothetical protein